MKKIKYICTSCNHIESYKPKDYVMYFIFNLFFSIGIFISILSIPIIIFISNPSTFTEVGRFDIVGFALSHSGNARNDDLKIISLNFTKNCIKEIKNSDELRECYAHKIYLFVKDFDYTLGVYQNSKIFTPEETINFHSGDCKNLAYTFTALSSQVGLDTEVVCGKDHCFNKATINNEKFLIDATNKVFGHWDDYEKIYFQEG